MSIIRLLLIALLLLTFVGTSAGYTTSQGASLTNEDIECAYQVSKLNDCEMACWMPLKDTVTSSKQCLEVIASCKGKCAGTSSGGTGSTPTTAIPVTTPTRITTIPTTVRTTSTTVQVIVTIVPTTMSPYPLHANILATETTGPAPLRVDFSDTSTGTVESRLWTFGDGYKSELPSPGHTYREPGTYIARLTVYDGLGQSDSDSVTVNVQQVEAVTTVPTGTVVNIVTPVITGTSGTPAPRPPDNIPITPGDVASGMEAGIAGIIGGAVAIGAGAATGIIPELGGQPPGDTDDYHQEMDADRIRQMQEDYKNALEQVEFLRSRKRGYEKEGFTSKERDDEIAYWEGQAQHLNDQLDSEGKGITYSPRERSDPGPGRAFVELGDTTRNLREQEQQSEERRLKYKHIDDAWANQIEQIQKNTADTNLINYDYAGMTMENIRKDLLEARDELTDINNWSSFTRGFVMDTAKDLVVHPLVSAGKVIDFTNETAKDMALHPVNTAVMFTTGVDMKGVIDSTDYHKPLLSRIGLFTLSTIDVKDGATGVNGLEITPPTGGGIPPVKNPVTSLQGKMKKILEGKEGAEYDKAVIDDKDAIRPSGHNDEVSTESLQRRVIMYEGSPNVRAVVLGRDGTIKKIVPEGTEHIDEVLKLKPDEVMMVIDRAKNEITDKATRNQDWVLSEEEITRLSKIAKDALEKSLRK